MYEHIIVGYDGSEGALDALTLAQALAPGERMTLVRAMPYEPFLSEVSIGPPATLVAERESTWKPSTGSPAHWGWRPKPSRASPRHEGYTRPPNAWAAT